MFSDSYIHAAPTARVTSAWPCPVALIGAVHDVVGVFPNPAALLRLAGSVLVEAHDEWQVADKRYLSEATLALLNPGDQPERTVAAPAQLTA
jgi:hypothetical protein